MNFMNKFYRILSILLLVLMPFSASAQFVPIQEAKDQVATAERTELNKVLTDISSKGDIARRNVQTILSDAAAKKIGASAAGRKIETVVGKLKTDLNGIINAFAKKNPPANQLRAAYNSAQDTLDNIRRQSGEVLDQVGFDKAADPKALSGKYLTYQNELKAITAKALEDADARLADRGTKATVTKDLERIAADTQKKIDIDTTTFLSTNTDILPSAIERVKKGVVEEFGKDMATRLATAKERGSDKSLDLSEEELAKVQAALEEMQAIADRATQTVDAAMQSVSGSGIPTSSNVPGQNPLLEAKIHASKQMQQIRDATDKRLEKLAAAFQSDSDNSALAKEVVAKKAKQIQTTMDDTLTEYNRYFKAGDPKNKAYSKAKQDAIDQAQGCTDFFCTVGRLASDVGSGVLAATTGVQIAPKTFTTIMGIKDPQGYVPSKYTGGNYSGSYSGNVPFNPGCYGSLPTKDSKAPRFSFVEKAQAQTSADETAATAQGGDSSSSGAGTFENAGGILNTSGSGSSGSGTKTTTTTKKSLDWSSVFRNISPWLNNTVQTAAGSNGYFGSCYGQSSGYGGLPGYGSVYGGMGSTTLGSIAAQQMFGTSNLGFNQGFIDQNNAGQRLAAALTLLGQTDSVNAAKYQQAVNILQSGPVTFDKIPQLRDALAGTNLNSTFGAYGDSNPISGLIYSVCAQAVNGDPALVGICRQMLTPIQTPGINPNANNSSLFPASTTQKTTDPDITQILTDTQTLAHISELGSTSKCSSFQKTVADIVTKTRATETKYIAMTASQTRQQVLTSISSLLKSAEEFTNTCTLAKATTTQPFAAKNEFDITREKIDDYAKAFVNLKGCDTFDREFGNKMRDEIPGLKTQLSATSSGRTQEVISAALNQLNELSKVADAFAKTCAATAASDASKALSPALGALAQAARGTTSTSGLDGKAPITIVRNSSFSTPYTYRVKIQNVSVSAREQAEPYEFSVGPLDQPQTIRLPLGKYWLTHELPVPYAQATATRYTITVTSQTGCSIMVPAGGLNPVVGSCTYDTNIAPQEQ
jgi:hypothetical protein